MPTSEARIAANQRNSLFSTGPKSIEGRRIAARNSLKHGLSGAGTVLAADDHAEVERLDRAFTNEMGPKSELGSELVHHLASITVRLRRASRQEFAATDERVRNAPENFDNERDAMAETLFEALHENPRANLRKLRRTPEGVILLLEAWHELKADLTRPSKPRWTAAQMVTMGNLLGIREEDVRGSQIGVLSDAIWGDFDRLGDHEGGNLKEDDRKAWARQQVAELIDETCADLEAHAETFDYETIELDRAESGDRALFDTSKPAVLARRYESELSRRLLKTLNEFKEAEARAAEVAASKPKPSAAAPPPASPLASFREEKRDLATTPLGSIPPELRPVDGSYGKGVEMARGADGQPLTFVRNAAASYLNPAVGPIGKVGSGLTRSRAEAV